MTITLAGRPLAAAQNVWTCADATVSLAGTAQASLLPLPELQRLPWHGGPVYFARFPNPGLLAEPDVFPCFEFYGSFSDDADAEAEESYGVQGSVRVTAPTNLQICRDTGWQVLLSPGEYTGSIGSETIGYVLGDEPDLNYGPGWSPTEGPGGGPQGYLIQQQVAALITDARAYPWYGSYAVTGILLFENPAQAAVFVNAGDPFELSPTPPDNWPQALLDADAYWYAGLQAYAFDSTTFLGLAPSQVARSQNYGWIVNQIRGLQFTGTYNTGAKPIWAVIEAGHPYVDGTYILPAQFNGACWNAIIAGAAGIQIFFHTFNNGASDPDWSAGTQYALGDNVWYAAGSVNYCAVYGTPVMGTIPPDDDNWMECLANFTGLRAGPQYFAAGMLDQIPATFADIQALATVINTQTLIWMFNASLETMLKVPGDGYAYIFAMQNLYRTSGTYSLTLPAGISGTTVTVLNESRTISISGGAFSDTFSAEYTVHIYQIALA
jgi:hypothetical protein